MFVVHSHCFNDVSVARYPSVPGAPTHFSRMNVVGDSGTSAGRPHSVQPPAQRPAQRPGANMNTTQRQSVASKSTVQRVAAGPGGRKVQVVETEEHIIKKTVWTRVMTSTSQAAAATKHHVMHPGKAVKVVTHHVTHPGKAVKAVKNYIPVVRAKSKHGENLGYYRKAFFALDPQKQYNLYMSGMAPWLTEQETNKVRAWGAEHGYKLINPIPVAVLYRAQQNPRGFRVLQIDRDISAAEAAKREVEAAKARKAANNPDRLPAHPTPGNYAKITTVPAKSRPNRLSAAQQHQSQQRPQHQSQHLAAPTIPHLKPVSPIHVPHMTQQRQKPRPQSQGGLFAQATAKRQSHQPAPTTKQHAHSGGGGGLSAQASQPRQIRQRDLRLSIAVPPVSSTYGMPSQGGRRVKGQSMVNPVRVRG